MAFQINIERNGLVPGATKRQIQQIKRKAMYDIASDWDKTKAATKFTPKGARKYGYKIRRTKDIFSGRKLKPYKDMTSGNPLTWTGQSQSMVTSGRISATYKTSHAAYSMPTLNRKPPGFARGQMSFEFKRVLPSEERGLARSAEKSIRSQFRRNKKNVQVSTGSFDSF